MKIVTLAAAAALVAGMSASTAQAQPSIGFDIRDCINSDKCDMAMVEITAMSGPNKGKRMMMPMVMPKGYVNRAPSTTATEDDLSCIVAGSCAYITVVQPK